MICVTVLAVLSVICVWTFGVPQAWAVAVTVMASLPFAGALLCIAAAGLLGRHPDGGGTGREAGLYGPEEDNGHYGDKDD